MKGIEEKQIEAPYELPEGWKWCRLGEVAEIARGGSPRPIEKYLTTAEDGINWIKIGDTEKNGKYIFTTKEKIIKEGLSKTRYVEEGDFLLTNSMSFGRPYILKTSGCIHDGWLVIKQCTAYNQDFLYYLLSSSAVFSQFVSLAKGSTVKNLKSETVRQVILPLPPTLAEQQRIVNRIESMFAKLDEAKEKAQNVVDGFETRKAAILHKAFTGELTAKWRKENGVSDDSWEEKTIGECGSVYGGGTPSTSHKDYWENGNILWITSKDMKNDIIEDSEMHVNMKGIENSSAKFIEKPALLFVMRSGILRRTFPICMVKKEFTVNQDLKALVPYGFVLLEYLFYGCKSNEREILNTCMKNGTTVESINAKALFDFAIFVPSLPEQQEIVRILEIIIEKENKAKQAAEAVLEQIDLLKKSILARAFRGEL